MALKAWPASRSETVLGAIAGLSGAGVSFQFLGTETTVVLAFVLLELTAIWVAVSNNLIWFGGDLHGA